MTRRKPVEQLSRVKDISVTLSDGRTVIGQLYTHVSGKGSFEVHYEGRVKTDGRKDYADIGHMTAIAQMILIEMAAS